MLELRALTLLCRPERDLVEAGASFSFVDLTTHAGARVLILDVLALAVKPGKTERRGVGRAAVLCLQELARREARALGARAVLMAQADLGCVGFWGKSGFKRALDVNALLRSLRRASDATLFTGAVPMALLLPDPKPLAPAPRTALLAHKAGDARRAQAGPPRAAFRQLEQARAQWG